MGGSASGNLQRVLPQMKQLGYGGSWQGPQLARPHLGAGWAGLGTPGGGANPAGKPLQSTQPGQPDLMRTQGPGTGLAPPAQPMQPAQPGQQPELMTHQGPGVGLAPAGQPLQPPGPVGAPGNQAPDQTGALDYRGSPWSQWSKPFGGPDPSGLNYQVPAWDNGMGGQVGSPADPGLATPGAPGPVGSAGDAMPPALMPRGPAPSDLQGLQPGALTGYQVPPWGNRMGGMVGSPTDPMQPGALTGYQVPAWGNGTAGSFVAPTPSGPTFDDFTPVGGLMGAAPGDWNALRGAYGTYGKGNPWMQY